MRLAALGENAVDGKLIIARHRADFLPHTLAGNHEERIDKTGRVEPRFADHATDGFGATEAPGAVNGKGHPLAIVAGRHEKDPALNSVKLHCAELQRESFVGR